jgi:hypothetical protein
MAYMEAALDILGCSHTDSRPLMLNGDTSKERDQLTDEFSNSARCTRSADPDPPGT